MPVFTDRIVEEVRVGEYRIGNGHRIGYQRRRADLGINGLQHVHVGQAGIRSRRVNGRRQSIRAYGIGKEPDPGPVLLGILVRLPALSAFIPVGREPVCRSQRDGRR